MFLSSPSEMKISWLCCALESIPFGNMLNDLEIWFGQSLLCAWIQHSYNRNNLFGGCCDATICWHLSVGAPCPFVFAALEILDWHLHAPMRSSNCSSATSGLRANQGHQNDFTASCLSLFSEQQVADFWDAAGLKPPFVLQMPLIKHCSLVFSWCKVNYLLCQFL